MVERNLRRKDNAKGPAKPKHEPLPPDRLKEQKKMDKALFEAVRRVDPEAVEKLLEEGADPNAKDDMGWTPLMYAAEEGLSTIAKLLVEKGADVSVKDEEGWSPIGIALETDHPRLARFLESMEKQ